jgi:hypothetical protein
LTCPVVGGGGAEEARLWRVPPAHLQGFQPQLMVPLPGNQGAARLDY